MLLFKARNSKVRAVASVILFAISAYLFNRCEEEKAQARSYPQVKTKPVTNITTNGATFNAEIYSLGSEPIIEHGFVWVGGKSPDLSDDRILLGPMSTANAYSTEIKTALAKDAEYTVKSFVKTAEHIVYGLPVTFVSLGSSAPVVTGFEPDSAAWMDTLVVIGKNFARKKADNLVKLNNVQCDVLDVSDTSIKILVSKDLSDLKSVVSVDIKGNVCRFIQDTMRLIAPRVTGITPEEATWRDEITISGQHFESEHFVNSITARIGNYPVSITTRDNTHLTMIVPDELATLTNVLKITFNKLDVVVSPGLKLKAPVLSAISPMEGTWKTIIKLKGTFHPKKERNNITIGGFTAQVISNFPDSIIVYAPDELINHNNLVVNNVAPFTIASQDTFKLKGPEIDSIAPLSGTSNTEVIIYGKYLTNGITNPTVKFGSTLSSNYYNLPTLIVCYVPNAISNGPVNVTVSVGSQSTTFKSKFNVQNPFITRISPLTGTFDDEITIEGTNLVSEGYNPDVYFGDYERYMYGTSISATQNKVVVRVPRNLDSIPAKLLLNYIYKSLQIQSSESFVLSPPEVLSVSPSTLTPGQTITIAGNNFNPDASRNKAFWGSIPLNITNASRNEIIAMLPDNMPRGSDRVSVSVGGYSRSYPGLFVINNSAWAIVPVRSPFEWNASIDFNGNGVSFAVGGLGYIMDYAGKMSSFDPSSQIFNEMGVFPEWSGILDLTCIIKNDTALLFAGDLGFFRFDKASARWIRSGSMPTIYRTGGFAFNVNGRLFYGGFASDGMNKYLWEYMSGSQTWIIKNNITNQFNVNVTGSFVANSKGYVQFGDNVLASYNPDNNTWSQMASCPGPSYIGGRVNFTIGNLYYVGLGRDFGSVYGHSDFYKYDPSSDSWTQILPMPGTGRYNSVSFVLNNKVYIGFGFTIPDYVTITKMKDFYEFDPNYILK